MGPIQGNFTSQWQLIIGQFDKLLTPLTSRKGRRDPNSKSLQSLFGGEKQNFWSFVFSLCMSDWLAKVQDSNVTVSLLPQPTLLVEAMITYRLVIPLRNAAFRWSLPSQNVFSITCGYVATYYKATLQFFLQSGHLNWW